MSFVHALIIGNIIVILFNLLGMISGLKPPPVAAYVIGWPAVITAVYLFSQ